MKTETNTNKAGFVVLRHTDPGDSSKTEAVSAPMISHAAATEYAEMCRAQGWIVSIIAKGKP